MKVASRRAYERVSEPLATRAVFARRMAASLGWASTIIGVSLAIGMLGYRSFEQLSWIDAFESAAMILSGMGPLAQMHTTGGKLFAGLYALYSGLVLIATASLVLAPALHRFLHRLHVEDTDQA
jgi:hypothetical protein